MSLKIGKVENPQNTLNPPSPISSPSHSQENELQNSEITNNNFTNPLVKVKLPTLELKPFDGNIINWKPFWDQFDVSIHSNDSISKIQKFNYLITFLSDSAKSCISGLTLTSENYDEAIKILEKRFGNKQILSSTFMQQFVSLPKIKAANDISGLRKLYDKIENSVRNLKTLNIEPDTYPTVQVQFSQNRDRQ